MADVTLLYSQFEPYLRFVNELATVLATRHTCSLQAVETFAFGVSLESASVFIPCSNHPSVSSMIQGLTALGQPVVNTGVGNIASNRLSVFCFLAAQDVRVPPFWSSINLSALSSLIPFAQYPVILKDFRLPKQTATVFDDYDALRHHIASTPRLMTASLNPYIIQSYFESESYLKVYFCFSRLAIYRKYKDYKRSPEIVEHSDALRSLATTISRILQLQVFSVDVIEYEHELHVVDVNTYPIFKYHPVAYSWLAAALESRDAAAE